MRRVLVLVVLAGGALAGAAHPGAASAATQVCQTVDTTGTVAEFKQVCVNNPLSGTTCITRGGGLDPTEDVFVTVCVPN
jgi:hypothetical protein